MKLKGSFGMFLATFLVLTSCSSKEDKTTYERKPVRVETLTVNGMGVDNSHVFSGTLQEGESSNISFSAAGTIKQFNVQQGDRIAQGQIIGTLDDSSLRSAYEIAQATLAQAQDAYNRMKVLHDSNSLPEIKWVDVQQKLVQAQNAADIAANALKDAVLRAPFSGVVAEKYADLGQVAAPGVPVIKLIKINTVKAVISVPQNQMVNFREGDRATVYLGDDKSRSVQGRLTEKGVSANPLSRTFDVKYLIDNSKGELLPGMICSVAVEGQPTEDVIVLPQSVVLLDEHNNNFVWVDSAGVARKRIVTVSQANSQGLEVTSGLTGGDKVIVKGIQKVCNGTKVESIN